MDDALLKSWVESQMKLGGLKAFMRKFEERKASMTIVALQPGDHEYEKGQVSALEWACDLPETIMQEDVDTGADT